MGAEGPTVAELLRGTDPVRLERELLLAEALGRPRSWLYAHPEHVPSPSQSRRFHELLCRRREGHPVAHLLARKSFWSLELEITPDTLIPRPETELLVELALGALDRHETARVLDLGTGTGAIALAIAAERPQSCVVGVDADARAVRLAERNAVRCSIANVRFLHGSWYQPLADERFDLIVSNPPYVAEDDPHLTEGDVRFEPRAALTSGADGLDDLRHIIGHAPARLEPGGWLLVEHGHDQRSAVVELFRRAGFSRIDAYADLAGKPRAVRGRIKD